jgi:hypothetical protein
MSAKPKTKRTAKVAKARARPGLIACHIPKGYDGCHGSWTDDDGTRAG